MRTKKRKSKNKLDQEAMVVKYTDLVWHEAHRVRRLVPPSFGDLEDVAQVGFAALLRALNTYQPMPGQNPTKGLTCWINRIVRQDILEAVLTGSTIKVGTHVQRLLREQDQVPRTVSQTAAIAALRVQTGDAALAKARGRNNARLDAVVARMDIQEAVARLPVRHRKILRFRFLEELSYEQIGKRFGVGKEMARQWTARALKLLRKRLKGSEDGYI